MKLIRALITAAAVALVATAVATPMSTPKLTGTVGPGFTISLKRLGKTVRTVKAGRYTVVVSDKSNIHNFHLRGPGVNKELTSVTFVGTKTVVVRMTRGTYRFVCDPHATSMKGSLRVT
jgi:plastocyanin